MDTNRSFVSNFEENQIGADCICKTVNPISMRECRAACAELNLTTLTQTARGPRGVRV